MVLNANPTKGNALVSPQSSPPRFGRIMVRQSAGVCSPQRLPHGVLYDNSEAAVYTADEVAACQLQMSHARAWLARHKSEQPRSAS